MGPVERSADQAIGSDAVPQPRPQQEASTWGKVQMLKIITVEKNPRGQLEERVLYVFGEDSIRQYREQQRRAAQVADHVAGMRSAREVGAGSDAHGLGGPASAAGTGTGVDGAASSVSGGGSIPSGTAKRPASDNLDSQAGAPKRLM